MGRVKVPTCVIIFQKVPCLLFWGKRVEWGKIGFIKKQNKTKNPACPSTSVPLSWGFRVPYTHSLFSQKSMLQMIWSSFCYKNTQQTVPQVVPVMVSFIVNCNNVDALWQRVSVPDLVKSASLWGITLIILNWSWKTSPLKVTTNMH